MRMLIIRIEHIHPGTQSVANCNHPLACSRPLAMPTISLTLYWQVPRTTGPVPLLSANQARSFPRECQVCCSCRQGAVTTPKFSRGSRSREPPQGSAGDLQFLPLAQGPRHPQRMQRLLPFLWGERGLGHHHQQIEVGIGPPIPPRPGAKQQHSPWPGLNPARAAVTARAPAPWGRSGRPRWAVRPAGASEGRRGSTILTWDGVMQKLHNPGGRRRISPLVVAALRSLRIAGAGNDAPCCHPSSGSRRPGRWLPAAPPPDQTVYWRRHSN